MTDNTENNTQPEESAEEIERRDLEEVRGKSLGMAGRITSAFIDSPISPLLMAATLFLGIMGLIFTPRQEDPQISVPMVDVFIKYPGADASQVASLVTEPLERILYEISGVRHIYSATQRGQAMVTVRFKVGEELETSIVKIHDKIQSNVDVMPPDAFIPLIKPKGIDDVPVVTVTLSSPSVDDAALRTLAVDVLQNLRQVATSGSGFVVGGRAEQVRIEVNPERLAGYGLTMAQIAETVQSANQQAQAGSSEASSSSFEVYTGSFLKTASEISRLIVGSRGGSPIYIRDVATVTEEPEEPKQIVSFYTGEAAMLGKSADGDPAVTIAIAKKVGTNGVSVANKILEKLDLLRGHLIPDNVNIDITRDYGKSANDKVNELLTALFEAALAVSVLCLIGLGFRAAFVVITVIPIVILITVFAAFMLDYTIDRVSLFALIFSIGILVDDATVVVENIFRRWMLAGRTTVGIAIDAVREVGNPTILATLTIISALLPMGWVSGLDGALHATNSSAGCIGDVFLPDCRFCFHALDGSENASQECCSF